MARVKLTSNHREKTGKGPARQLRRDGRIPAVMYATTAGQNVLLDVDMRETEALLHKYGYNAIIDLTVQGGAGAGEHLAMVADYQKDVFGRHFTHLDLREISLDKPVLTDVPIRLVGESPGVKLGGVLEQRIRVVPVKALPLSLPEYLELDISQVALGGHVAVHEIRAAEGVEILAEAHETILVVHAPRVATAEEEAAEAAAAASAAEGEAAEEKSEE